MSGLNPLRDAHDSLWSCLEDVPEFLVMFPNGSLRQVLSDDLDLQECSPADYPRCRIRYVTDQFELAFNSDQSTWDAVFVVEVCTGTQDQGKLMDAAFSIYRGIARWISEMESIVKWQNKNVVVAVRSEKANATDQNAERNRGTNQWIGVFPLTITMAFNTSDLRTY